MAACLLVASGLAACSGGSSGTHPSAAPRSSTSATAATDPDVAIVNATAAKTLAEKTAQVSLALAVSGGPNVTISGPFDLSQGTGQLSLDVSGTGFQGAIPNPATLLYSDGDLYLGASGVLLSFDGDKPWAQVTTSALESILCILLPGANTAGIAKIATGNPGDLLDILDTTDMTVATGASTDVDGTTVTDYTVDINPIAAERTSTGVAQEIFQQMSTNGSSALVDVGIDSTGVLHSLSASFPASGHQVQLSLTLSGFGTPVSATAPPRSEIGQISFPGGCGTTSTS